MSTFLERTLYDALAKYLMDQGVKNVVKVTGFETDSWVESDCGCCGSYVRHQVDVYYERTDSDYKGVYTYHGSFDDLFGDMNRV